MNPDLAAAFDRIDSLLDVDPAHKDRTDLLAWLNENGWTDATGDFHVNAAALAARLAATEAPRFETFDAADGHKGIRLAATPDHTEGGEEPT